MGKKQCIRKVLIFLQCDVKKETRELCPVTLPCGNHDGSVNGYTEHLEGLVGLWIKNMSDTCVVIPCDSAEAWIIAAFDEVPESEQIGDPWTNIISKKKAYHDIRTAGDKKRKRVYEQFVEVVCANWAKVTELCFSTRRFEENIILFHNRM